MANTSSEAPTLTRGQKTQSDVTALLRARNTLLWVVTREEVRVERAVIEAAAAAQYQVRLWDCAAGVTDATGRELPPGTSGQDPQRTLTAIASATQRAVWIMRDLPQWLKDPVTLRMLRNLARSLQSAKRDEARAVIVLSPSSDLPPELSGHATVIDWPLPDRAEIASILDDVILAPFFEEVVFRGLLFAALRRRFGFAASAGLSAAIFALGHGYGAVGSLSVFWSGLLWAWAYEKTKSLLPAMGAHAAGNLMVALEVLGLFR